MPPPANTTLLHLTDLYLRSLLPAEKKAYEIAKDHLGCSFQIEKSNGFLQWMKKQTVA